MQGMQVFQTGFIVSALPVLNVHKRCDLRIKADDGMLQSNVYEAHTWKEATDVSSRRK
jgi:hypothetical protein